MPIRALTERIGRVHHPSMFTFPERVPEGRPAFRLLFAALLVVGVGNSLLFPVLPPLAREIGIPDWATGWVFSLSALIWVFSSPYWGRASDRIGRRPIIAMGLGAYAISMAAFALIALIGLTFEVSWIPVFLGLVMARSIFGLFGSASSPAAQAYVADHTEGKARLDEMAALISAFALGSAMGPAAGILAAALGPVALIALVALMAACSAFAVWRLLPEPPRQGDLFAPSEPAFAGSLALARDPRVAAYLIYGLGLSIATGTLAQTFGFYTIDQLELTGMRGVQFSAAGFMVGALASLLAQLAILPRLTLGTRQLMVAGGLLVAAGVAAQILADNLPLLLIAQLLQGLGFGLARAGFASGASLSVKPEEQGAAAGLVVAANGAGFVVSPMTGPMLYSAASHAFGPIGRTAPLWAMLALLLAMALFAWRSRRLKASVGAARKSPPADVP